MAKKKVEDAVVVTRIPKQTQRQFRIACAALGTDRGKVVAELIKDWIEEKREEVYGAIMEADVCPKVRAERSA